MHNLRQDIGLNTMAVHGGESPDKASGASAPNIVMSTTFIAAPDAAFSSENFGEDTPFFYTRWGNPTVQQLERKLALLENADDCIAFASGMAAITALFTHTLSAGDHLIISDVTYAAAAEYSRDTLPRFGVTVTRVNMTDPDALRACIQPNTKLIYIETPCNPILRLTDISAIAAIAKEYNIRLAVDSTFATPVATNPITLGADYVVHSLTKYIGGHGDAIGGALLGPKEEMAPLRQKTAIRIGGIISPFNAWLIMRGMATLPLRMRAHQENAMQIAMFLESHQKVEQVTYPGLPSHPQYELAQKQMRNYSGMVTFRVADSPKAAKIFAENLQIIHYAVSLGHHRSLIFYIPTADLLQTTFEFNGDQLQAYREFAGDGVFRLSVGIEDADDLCRDLQSALEKI